MYHFADVYDLCTIIYDFMYRVQVYCVKFASKNEFSIELLMFAYKIKIGRLISSCGDFD